MVHALLIGGWRRAFSATLSLVCEQKAAMAIQAGMERADNTVEG
jgi:hypothetical protein